MFLAGQEVTPQMNYDFPLRFIIDIDMEGETLEIHLPVSLHIPILPILCLDYFT